jgi:CheY-like chemotaxis protein
MMNLILPSLKTGLECDEDDEFKVDTFNDPIETLSNYKTGHYDLLLDVKMPNINGFELYREIRKRDIIKSIFAFSQHLSIIIMTNLKIFTKLDVTCFTNKLISIYYGLAKRINEELDNENTRKI